MVSSATVVAATRSASDSNLRCRERKWFRLLRPWRQRYSASDTNFRCRKEKWFRLQNATSQRLQRFLISGGQFENRCKECPGLAFLRAAILDFKPRLANRCSQKVKTRAIRASILNFKPRLANRCRQKVKTGTIRALILDFRPRIGNHCSKEGINGQKTCSTSSARVPSRVDDASCLRCLASHELDSSLTAVRQWRQKRVLMRPEAAFPYVFAAEGAQHPPKKPPRSTPCRHEIIRRHEKNRRHAQRTAPQTTKAATLNGQSRKRQQPPRSTGSPANDNGRKDLPQARHHDYSSG